MPARCSHKTVAGPQAPHGSREGPSTQRGTMRTRGHACTGTHVHGNMHTQRNTPTSLRGGCRRADGVAACRTTRVRTHAATRWRELPHAAPGKPGARGCASMRATGPARPSAVHQAVRGGGSVSSPPCPQVTVCFGMNHTPSLCLGFPAGAGGPRQFCRRGTRRRQGLRLPAQPQAGVPEPRQPCASSPCARFCTRVHAQGTHASSSMHVHNRPPMHAPHRDSSHPHLSRCTHRHARCLAGANHAHTCATTHVCNHTHVQSHTCTQSVPPPSPCRVWAPRRLCTSAAPRCAPLQRLRGNAPDLSMETLRENAPGEAGGRGGVGWELVGDRRAAVGGPGKPGCRRDLCTLAV